WVSILPWVIAPLPNKTGNVVPRNVTAFQFIPDVTGSYVIQHTVHGFSGTLIVDKPIISGATTPQAVPEEYTLFQNYPNPFNPTTKITFYIPQLSFVTLKVYDVLGNEIATFVNEEKPTGSYEVEFNTSDLPSGIYFYRLQAGDPSIKSRQSFVETKKMLLLK
ncbi:MAG: T9SS type A sorting domain-containing protein, partial [Ignavibacteriaceae bacterium]